MCEMSGQIGVTVRPQSELLTANPEYHDQHYLFIHLLFDCFVITGEHWSFLMVWFGFIPEKIGIRPELINLAVLEIII